MEERGKGGTAGRIEREVGEGREKRENREGERKLE